MGERRKDPRSLIRTLDYQEKRRREALRQQSTGRSRVLNAARSRRHDPRGQLAATVPTAGNDGTHILIGNSTAIAEESFPQSGASLPSLQGTDLHAGLSEQNPRHQWAALFMIPEWLIEIPPRLAKDWYVLPRPEGQRCLVVAEGGRTIARLRNGVTFEQFASALPSGGGGRSDEAGSGDKTVLDCIFHPPNATYYVLDVLSWRGHEVCDCTTEFRQFWLHSKLAEEGSSLSSDKVKSMKTYGRFEALPLYPATLSGLRAAYAEAMPFVRDGLYFVHRLTQYAPGQTPLALTWKDNACSRYAVDTNASGTPLPEQNLILRYDGTQSRYLYTSDDPPIALGCLPSEFVESMGPKLRAGRLLRFALGPGGLTFCNGQPSGADLRFLGAANQRRGRADTLSKILFQRLMRTQPITIAELVQAAATSEGEEELPTENVGSADAGASSIGMVREEQQSRSEIPEDEAMGD